MHLVCKRSHGRLSVARNENSDLFQKARTRKIQSFQLKACTLKHVAFYAVLPGGADVRAASQNAVGRQFRVWAACHLPKCELWVEILLCVAWSAHCSGAVMRVLGATCPLWGLCSPFYHLYLGLLTLGSCLGNTLLPLPPFTASCMTVSYLERKGGQGHFQELLMEK